MSDEGILLTKDIEIIQELHAFYSNLFSERPQSTKVELAIDELLRHTINHIDRNTKAKLKEVTSMDEITNTLKNLPNNISLGIDGLTNKVFWKCWDFIKSNFYDMAVGFWEIGYLILKIKDGVIKFVPKSSVKLHAKDWHALTMLTIVYKILAKLLSNRLKPIMPMIISPQ